MSFINNEDIICMKEKNLDLLKNSNNNNYERNKFSKINLIYREIYLDGKTGNN